MQETEFNRKNSFQEFKSSNLVIRNHKKIKSDKYRSIIGYVLINSKIPEDRQSKFYKVIVSHMYICNERIANNMNALLLKRKIFLILILCID